MKKFIIYTLMITLTISANAAAFSSVKISNGEIDAVVGTSVKAPAYYEGTRFDRSGLIFALNYNGHSYFGEWFPKYDPKINDTVCGPAEEFAAVGYEDTPKGGDFLKIGVGMLRKNDVEYDFRKLYDISNAGVWTIRSGVDFVEFRQVLSDKSGYAYEYVKTIKLVAGQPRMLIEHSLKNTGTKKIKTTVYNHNFFMIDNLIVSPELKVKFPFDIKEKPAYGAELLCLSDARSINFTKKFDNDDMAIIRNLRGSGTCADYNFLLKNLKSGASVRISGDKPLFKATFWCCRTTACIEPFIEIDIDSGEEATWKNIYDFDVSK